MTAGILAEQIQEGRRSSVDMVCDILRVLSEGQSKPTWILQRANMNWNVLTGDLDYLCVRGMVEKVGQRKRVEYRLTSKGRSILEMYETLKSSLTGVANAYPAHHERALAVVVNPGFDD
jgi:predicted transcriptional regulator